MLRQSNVIPMLSTIFQQFRDRYKGFKVPLFNVRAGGLLKKLRDSGTRISVTSEQAKKLRRLEQILTISEVNKTAIDDLGNSITGTKTASKPKVNEENTSQEAEEEEDAELDVELDAPLLGKFVDLVDLLPPLPTKGTFDVEDIQRSPYFFS
jgi:DNA-directed RNA polymerase